jgi:hypothetical protein
LACTSLARAAAALTFSAVPEVLHVVADFVRDHVGL